MPNKFIEDDVSTSIEVRGKRYFLAKNGSYYKRILTKAQRKQRFYYRFVPCAECGKPAFHHVSSISRNDKDNLSCSKECKKKLCSGPRHWNWRSEVLKPRSNGKTAIRVWNPNHPYAQNNRIYAHREVMEKKLGRILDRKEVVHHIDCDPHNNDLKNLALCESGSQHLLAHGSLNMCVKELLARGHLKFSRKKMQYFLPK